jgi:hypothetical protein
MIVGAGVVMSYLSGKRLTKRSLDSTPDDTKLAH